MAGGWRRHPRLHSGVPGWLAAPRAVGGEACQPGEPRLRPQPGETQAPPPRQVNPGSAPSQVNPGFAPSQVNLQHTFFYFYNYFSLCTTVFKDFWWFNKRWSRYLSFYSLSLSETSSAESSPSSATPAVCVKWKLNKRAFPCAAAVMANVTHVYCFNLFFSSRVEPDPRHMRVRYDFTARNAKELSINKGEIVTVSVQSNVPVPFVPRCTVSLYCNTLAFRLWLRTQKWAAAAGPSRSRHGHKHYFYDHVFQKYTFSIIWSLVCFEDRGLEEEEEEYCIDEPHFLDMVMTMKTKMGWVLLSQKYTGGGGGGGDVYIRRISCTYVAHMIPICPQLLGRVQAVVEGEECAGRSGVRTNNILEPPDTEPEPEVEEVSYDPTVVGEAVSVQSFSNNIAPPRPWPLEVEFADGVSSVIGDSYRLDTSASSGLM